jgi:serine protease AprX
MGGTSMAAPYVAGCAALVREWYAKQAAWPEPSAALLKATLINGTSRMKGWDAIAKLEGDPNHHQGFGRIAMASTLPNPTNPALKLVFVDTWQDPGKALQRDARPRWRMTVKAGGEVPLRLCLVWTDPPGRGIWNTATLLVEAPNKKYIGNSGAAATLFVAGASQEPYNNVQAVRIEKPLAGDYTIAVTAGTLLAPPQHFAFVISGNLDSNLIPL